MLVFYACSRDVGICCRVAIIILIVRSAPVAVDIIQGPLDPSGARTSDVLQVSISHPFLVGKLTQG